MYGYSIASEQIISPTVFIVGLIICIVIGIVIIWKLIK